jgi:hypothetical protein
MITAREWNVDGIIGVPVDNGYESCSYFLLSHCLDKAGEEKFHMFGIYRLFRFN